MRIELETIRESALTFSGTRSALDGALIRKVKFTRIFFRRLAVRQ